MDEKNKRAFGSTGETIAVSFLQKNGYKFITKNYRVGRLGEIDIIARDGEYLCFIEVKTRKNDLYGIPSEAVTKKKQRGIIKLASLYMAQKGCHNDNARFDVVEIYYHESKDYKINLIKNAF